MMYQIHKTAEPVEALVFMIEAEITHPSTSSGTVISAL